MGSKPARRRSGYGGEVLAGRASPAREGGGMRERRGLEARVSCRLCPSLPLLFI